MTDDELTALALAADPDTEVADGAVSLWDLHLTEGQGQEDALLPGWYMPAPMAGPRSPSRLRRWVVALIIVSFIAINAYGLCSTYGEVL